MNKSRKSLVILSPTDSGGYSGLSRDCMTVNALGAHAVPICTGITHQDASQPSIRPTDSALIENQFKPYKNCIGKLGAIVNQSHMDLIASLTSCNNVRLVVDPVIRTSSGIEFLNNEAVEKFKKVILPIAEVVTPNIPEAEILSGIKISSHDSMLEAAQTLISHGAKHIVVKGGHFDSTPALDLYCSRDEIFWLNANALATKNVRATGCVFATSLATSLALGYSVKDSVVIAKMATYEGIAHAYEADGQLCCDAREFPSSFDALPSLNKSPSEIDLTYRFPDVSLPDGTPADLGIYPIVEKYEDLQTLLEAGAKTLQLRIKEFVDEAQLFTLIRKSVALALSFNARLFVNDYWQLAIEAGAYGVHLGQEDIDSANLELIHKAGLRLGVSTHCHYEVARAHTFKPSYIACGPVFPTQTKIMPWETLGVDGVRYFSGVLSEYPVVCIGGIEHDFIQPLKAAGANGVAMISAILREEKPTEAFRRFSELYAS